jgi:hypothetical protein
MPSDLMAVACAAVAAPLSTRTVAIVAGLA